MKISEINVSQGRACPEYDNGKCKVGEPNKYINAWRDLTVEEKEVINVLVEGGRG